MFTVTFAVWLVVAVGLLLAFGFDRDWLIFIALLALLMFLSPFELVLP